VPKCLAWFRGKLGSLKGKRRKIGERASPLDLAQTANVAEKVPLGADAL